MSGMKVRDVMTSPAVTVTPETPFTAVVATLLEHDFSGVPVVDPQRGLVGVVSETDLVGRQVYGYRRRARRVLADHLRGRDTRWVRKAGGLTAGELMTRAPETVRPDDSVKVAARRMLEAGCKRLVVVADGTDGGVVGVVSRHDVLRPFARPDTETLDDIRRLLADPIRFAEDHTIEPTAADGLVTLYGTVRRPSDIEIAEIEIGRIPGVVAVDNRLRARKREPLVPPLRRW
jgi:CBS domain-containing protein